MPYMHFRFIILTVRRRFPIRQNPFPIEESVSLTNIMEFAVNFKKERNFFPNAAADILILLSGLCGETGC